MFSFTFDVALVLFLLSMLFYLFGLVSEKHKYPRTIGRVALFLGAVSALVFLADRWYETGRPPFISTFEVMVFFAASTAAAYLIVEHYYKADLLGFPAALLVLGVMILSTRCEQAATPVMPALQNNFWLTIHVSICFVGYAAFLISYAASLLYLMSREGFAKKLSMYFISLSFVAPFGLVFVYPPIKDRFRALAYKTADFFTWAGADREALNEALIHALLVAAGVLLAAGVVYCAFSLIEERMRLGGKLARIENLPRISYKAVLAGFVLLGIGIVTGSVWTEAAWGAYWSWDPKETWALITWLVYLAYLHLRRVRGWGPERLSWVLVGGFLAVMFTFFGVSFLLSGLHSYL